MRSLPDTRVGAAGAALVLAAAAALGAGCGAQTPDLFLLKRSGSAPSAKLTLLVNDAGTVRCNGGPAKRISSSELLSARRIQELLTGSAKHHRTFAPRPGAVLRYRVRTPAGVVAFADTAAAGRPVLARLVLLTQQLERAPCGL